MSAIQIIYGTSFVWLLVLPLMFGGAFGFIPMMATPDNVKSWQTQQTVLAASITESTTTAMIPSSSSRRTVLGLLWIASSQLLVQPLVNPEPAHAAYGTSSNMELPNYIEFLLEKNAVPDEGAFLYQGPDPQVQLQRLLDATKRLDSIAPLAEDKKWSQIQGLLTGPLGTLAQTLTAIASNASSKSSTAELMAKSKKVKEDIYTINLAASQKNPDAVVTNAQAAQASLEAFVRAAF